MTDLILSVAEMMAADKRAIAAGTPGYTLMQRAGGALADLAASLASQGRILILCGPGNNGGDGFAAAQHLKAAGREVAVFLLGDPSCLRGDAARAYQDWTGPTAPLGAALSVEGALVVDALFGAGLSRPLSGVPAALAQRGWPCVLAVDLPSGVQGDQGVIGPHFTAHHTLTFAAQKPAHLLAESRAVCGKIHVADIGISGEVLAGLGVNLRENGPALWRSALTWPDHLAHKHQRGHLLCVTGGPAATGAARLSARAGLRIGAGLVTLASPPSAVLVNAAQVTSIMVRSFQTDEVLQDVATSASATLIGPAAGIGAVTRANAAALLRAGGPCVLDADALTSFGDDPEVLFDALRPVDVLTPHWGEFRRLFPDIAAAPGSRIDMARHAADMAGCVIVLKGADTVVAAPDGRAAINAHASPWLATAGSGDVLAGLIGGLLATGMATFEAANAGVWMHGDLGLRLGPGLIAEDLTEAIPETLRALKASL